MIEYALGLLTGLVVGYYAWSLYWRVYKLYDRFKDSLESQSGVVRPTGTRQTRNEPINLKSKTGGIRRMTPDEIKLANLKEREERIRNL